jgi:hypothetical protein
MGMGRGGEGGVRGGEPVPVHEFEEVGLAVVAEDRRDVGVVWSVVAVLVVGAVAEIGPFWRRDG